MVVGYSKVLSMITSGLFEGLHSKSCSKDGRVRLLSSKSIVEVLSLVEHEEGLVLVFHGD